MSFGLKGVDDLDGEGAVFGWQGAGLVDDSHNGWAGDDFERIARWTD